MDFKKGHYYKGLNPDDTYVIYKVIRVYCEHNVNTVEIEIIIDYDKEPSRHMDKGMKAYLPVSFLPKVTIENRWISESKEVIDKVELLTFVL